MSEDITQPTPTEEAPQGGQAEEVDSQGVTDIEAQNETGEDLQSREEQLDKEAQESLFNTLSQKKGWETPEDMARSYQELESFATQRSQSEKKAREELEAVESVLQGLFAGEIAPSEIAEEPDFVSQPDESIKNQLNQMQARLDTRTVADRYQDFADYTDKMSEILQRTPNKDVFRGVGGIELLYKMARTEHMDSELSRAKEEGKKELTLKEIEKTRASVADGNKAKQTGGQKIYTRAEIQAMSMDEFLAKREIIDDQQRQGLIR